jgi:uncharacterized protein (DUF736 family)
VSYDNTNTGALFKNKDKKSEKHPDYRGTVNVGGTEYYLASWLKTSKAGEKYMSLSVTEKNENNTRTPPREQPKSDDFDDDLPF